jgi:hypothetical protein
MLCLMKSGLPTGADLSKCLASVTTSFAHLCSCSSHLKCYHSCGRRELITDSRHCKQECSVSIPTQIETPGFFTPPLHPFWLATLRQRMHNFNVLVASLRCVLYLSQCLEDTRRHQLGCLTCLMSCSPRFTVRHQGVRWTSIVSYH